MNLDYQQLSFLFPTRTPIQALFYGLPTSTGWQQWNILQKPPSWSVAEHKKEDSLMKSK